ncbi:MAG: MerR family transcriptional regulator, partial [Rhodobacter sp.]|nr:MerR family transcriptional regulator [Rhodobacter sp.]
MTQRRAYVNVNFSCKLAGSYACHRHNRPCQQFRKGPDRTKEGHQMNEPLMTIREMCAEFEVTPRTLRFYESKELLSPIREGQRRLFTKRDRGRLKLILRGKRFGFSLEEIR